MQKNVKKQSKWHSRAVLGRDKARVGLKTIFGGENVGGPHFRGAHFGPKIRPKSVQKRHAKINQIYRFFSKKHPNFFGHKTQA